MQRPQPAKHAFSSSASVAPEFLSLGTTLHQRSIKDFAWVQGDNSYFAYTANFLSNLQEMSQHELTACPVLSRKQADGHQHTMARDCECGVTLIAYLCHKGHLLYDCLGG